METILTIIAILMAMQLIVRIKEFKIMKEVSEKTKNSKVEGLLVKANIINAETSNNILEVMSLLDNIKLSTFLCAKNTNKFKKK